MFPVTRVASSMIFPWFSSREEEAVSRFVAIKLPCRPLWRAAEGVVRPYSLNWSMAMAQQWVWKALGADMLRVLSRSRWNINGSKPALASRLEGKSMTKFWASSPWFFQSVDLDSEGSVVLSWRWPDAHPGKIILTHSEHCSSQSPSHCFWQDIFPSF